MAVLAYVPTVCLCVVACVATAYGNTILAMVSALLALVTVPEISIGQK